MASYTIPEVAKKLNFTPQYVRALIRKGLLASRMEPIVQDSTVKRHMITDEDIARYQGLTSHKTSRRDGRNKYVIYLKEAEREAAVTALVAAGLKEASDTLRTWNNLKPKPELTEQERIARETGKELPRAAIIARRRAKRRGENAKTTVPGV